MAIVSDLHRISLCALQLEGELIELQCLNEEALHLLIDGAHHHGGGLAERLLESIDGLGDQGPEETPESLGEIQLRELLADGRADLADARTGALDWSFRTEGSRRDPLKVLDAELRLDQAAFHPVTGDFGDMYVDFYRFTTVGGIMASPAVVDGVIYFGSLDGKLYALR
jgi:hypothetical protein